MPATWLRALDPWRPDGGRPPSRLAMAAEARVASEWMAGRLAWRGIAARHDGGGGHVLVLPGFLAGDDLTVLLRRTLAAAGHVPHGWALGLNEGATPALLDAMLDRVVALSAAAPGGRIAIVGWSLGGLYARELAKRAPDRVARVVTLGSPFSGDLRWTSVWRLYERRAGHSVDDPPIPIRREEKPPVPTIALWSPRDGVVPPACARGLPGESDRRVRVPVSHLGFTCAPAALSAILAALDTPSRNGA